MEELNVGLGDRSYPILIGSSLLLKSAEHLSRVSFPRRVALISNETVAPLYEGEVRKSLEDAGYNVTTILLPDGEAYKTLASLEIIYDALIKENFDRSTGLIALGGGVIGDIVGFAAATYLRGIPFAQIPTTLLAQVDSSVGGKTAVNHPLGKNLIGAFYQPQIVLIDVATLKTLPARELSAGLAEVVKYGVIKDRSFFDWLVQQGEDLHNLSSETLIAAVKRSCQIKANVVEVDEKESSIRAILNYGHTFGHAVEMLSGYGNYRHGEAVAIGMVAAADISRRLGRCSSQDVEAVRDLLVSFHLPVLPPSFPLDDYLHAMGRDKKVQEGRLRLVLNCGLGDCSIETVAEPDRLFGDLLEHWPVTGVA